MKKGPDIKDILGNQTDIDLVPYYKQIYLPDSIELESVEHLLKSDSIDEKACLTILSNSCKAMKADFNNYLWDEYQDLDFTDSRLPYIDISNMSRFVLWKLTSKDTSCFDTIFQYAEQILLKGTESTRNLIVIGFFEGIQNNAGWHKIDYYHGFDQWLQPKSKKAWNDLIKFWEEPKKKRK